MWHIEKSTLQVSPSYFGYVPALALMLGDPGLDRQRRGYDLANLATLRGWSVNLSIVDLAWGTLVTSLAATAGYFGARRFSAIAATIL